MMATLVTGCAWNGRVEEVRVGLNKPVSKAVLIYVKEFDSSKAAVNGDYHDIQGMVAAQRRIVSSTITRWTICRLTQLGYIAKVYSNQILGDALVVDGKITTISAGSAASRLWVGIGAGHSTVRANVKLYQAANPATMIADFQVAATSGPESESGHGTEVLFHSARDVGATVAEYISQTDKNSGRSFSRNY